MRNGEDSAGHNYWEIQIASKESIRITLIEPDGENTRHENRCFRINKIGTDNHVYPGVELPIENAGEFMSAILNLISDTPQQPT